MAFAIEKHPSGAEAQGSWRLTCGTAEAVPFQSKSFMDFHVHAIALIAIAKKPSQSMQPKIDFYLHPHCDRMSLVHRWPEPVLPDGVHRLLVQPHA
jgi:hypothetical protein